jgi:hypothetical protein
MTGQRRSRIGADELNQRLQELARLVRRINGGGLALLGPFFRANSRQREASQLSYIS